MKYDYSKLRTRIHDKYGSFARFAEALGITKSTLSLKLNNKASFTLPEIEKSLLLLSIERNEIYDYYLTPLESGEGFDYNKIEGLTEIKETLAAQMEWLAKGDSDGAAPNPLPLVWKYPQAMAYYTLETEAEDNNNELAARYLKRFQENPSQWESIMKQYEEEERRRKS